MKKLKYLPALIIAVFALFFFDSCKYEDGPAISFRSRKERVANTWKLDQYLVNGVDSTLGFEYLYNTARWTFNKNGGFMFSYIWADTTVSAIGEWEFTSNDEAINLNYVTFADTITKQTLTILRLKEKEFWFKRSDMDTMINANDDTILVPMTRELHLEASN